MLPGVDDVTCWSTLQGASQQRIAYSNGGSSSSSMYSSSAFASTLSGSSGSASARASTHHSNRTQYPEGEESLPGAGDTKSWLFGPGGFFGGLAGTFGFMGTIGSLRSTASSSLRSTATLGGTDGAAGQEQSMDDLVVEMAKAQVRNVPPQMTWKKRYHLHCTTSANMLRGHCCKSSKSQKLLLHWYLYPSRGAPALRADP